MGYDPDEERDEHGRWSGGGGGSSSSGRISQGFSQAAEWVKSGEAQRALSEAITPERVKTAVALGIKSALYHAGNMDDAAMEVLDPYIHHHVENVAANLKVATGRARDLMIAGTRKLIEARRAALGG